MPTVIASAEDRNATASWSGYVYQGKLGILVALRNISELFTADEANIETRLDGWLLEFETCEDFDIRSPEGVISRHQVKAKKVEGAHLKGTYSGALRDFDATNCPAGSRYLHTVCAITNWDSSPVANPSNVELYAYPDGDLFCDLDGDEVQSFAVAYLRVIKPGALDDMLVQIYYYLNALLLDEINNTHTTNPSLSLAALYLAVKDSPLDQVQDKIHAMRLKGLLVKYLEELKTELNTNGENLGVSWGKAEAQVEALCSMDWDELKNFLMDIHPANATFAKDFDFNGVGFKEVFLDLLRSAPLEFNSAVRGYRHKKESYVASTINDSDRAKVNIARQIVKNPNNAKVMFEGKNIVTKNIQYNFSELTGGEYGNTILDPNNMKFVKLDETIDAFNTDEEN